MRVLPAVLLAAVVGVKCWPTVRDRVHHHPYFAVRDVIVHGARHLAPDTIRAAAGVEPGMSVWDVDATAAEARLRGRGWIRAARVRRELPRRVVIEVREERAAAILAVDDGAATQYYVSPHGRLLAPVTRDARDLPYVTGLAAADLRAEDGFALRALRRALRLARRPGLEVSEVHVDRLRGFTLMPTRPAVPIELGWHGFDAKLARLPRVLALWAGRERDIAAVNCVFDDEVIVRPRASAEAPTPRRVRRS